MPREPRWTNETTKRVAHLILKACQPGDVPGEPIDFEQVLAFLAAHRDAAVRKRNKQRKAK